MKALSEFKSARKMKELRSLESILNQKVLVHGYRTFEGKFGRVYVMDVELQNGERVDVGTGAAVIAEALEAALEADAFPVTATFVRRKTYYDIE